MPILSVKHNKYGELQRKKLSEINPHRNKPDKKKDGKEIIWDNKKYEVRVTTEIIILLREVEYPELK